MSRFEVENQKLGIYSVSDVLIVLLALQMFAGIYRDFVGEIGVWGFQIYGDCMYTRNPCNFVISTL